MASAACVVMANRINAQGTTYKIGQKGPTGGWIFYDKGDYEDGGEILKRQQRIRGSYHGVVPKKQFTEHRAKPSEPEKKY